MPRVNLKEQIVVAAVEVLHEKGFNATSVQDLTDAAKAPKGSFYNHFDSKESLAIAALDRYWLRVLEIIRGLSDEKTPALARLKGHFRRLGDVARAPDYRIGCFIGNMSTEMPGQSDPVRERLSTLWAAWTRAIESCVREAQADGSLRGDMPAGTVAAFLLNSWEGAIVRSKVDRDDRAVVSFEDVAFTMLAAPEGQSTRLAGQDCTREAK
jgi:TetR/AcrR family transcriptional repressor of nem operon